jgi:excisionase family DNA binding protein
MEERQFYKSNEVTKIFGIHRNTFINWVKDGRIKASKIGRQYFVSKDEIERLKNEIQGVK